MVRVVRRFYKFPMPQFLANLIDNPLRRRLQPPADTAVRHGIEPGMTVLEIGPGNGTYTMAFARRVGLVGSIVAADIEIKMAQRVKQRAQVENIANVLPLVASAHDLPFLDQSFDAATMITVMGEIPHPVRALGEIVRSLRATGHVACSELIFDPDYPRAETLLEWAEQAGLRLRQRTGNLAIYTLLLERGPAEGFPHEGNQAAVGC